MNPSLTDSRRQALRSASHWYAVLSGERVSPQQEARWQQWYEQDQDNQWAWQQVENLRNQLGGVPGDVASRALHDTRLTRRHVIGDSHAKPLPQRRAALRSRRCRAAPERDVPAEKYRCDPERYRSNASR